MGFNYTGFIQLRDQLAVMEKSFDGWLESFLLKRALTVLQKTKLNTPVDTGWLRGEWFVGNIARKGGCIEVTIENNTEYASFVEYGHMNRSRTSWVEGRFMCSIAIHEMETSLPAKFRTEYAKWAAGLGAEIQ